MMSGRKKKKQDARARHSSGKAPPYNRSKAGKSHIAASFGEIREGAGAVTISEEEYRNLLYTRVFEEELTALEKRLHSAEDPMEIAIEVLRTACVFYQAEWAGVLFVDLEAGVWTAEAWYDVRKGPMKDIAFKELEYAENFMRWVKCLKECRPVIIPDCEEIAREAPKEHEFYKLVGAKSIMAVPFWKHPTGFLVVKNPKLYASNSHMLQILAYVAMMSAREKAKAKSAEHMERPLEIRGSRDIIINVLGGLEITTAIGTVTQEKLSSEKGCKLLTYLLLAGRPVQPWDIVHTLWPNDSAKDPMGNLRSLIYSIRTKLNFIMEENLIVSTEHGYRLNPEFNIITDFSRFEECWKEAANAKGPSGKKELLIRAFNLYRGNLLPLSAGEQWCITESSYYNTIYLRLVKELLHLLSREQDYWAVRDYATRALRIEPGNMEAYKYLIRAFRKAGSSEMAKQELYAAKQNLSEEEYMDLVNLLNAGRKGLWPFGTSRNGT